MTIPPPVWKLSSEREPNQQWVRSDRTAEYLGIQKDKEDLRLGFLDTDEMDVKEWDEV